MRRTPRPQCGASQEAGYTSPTGSFLLGHETGHSIARPTACGSRVPPQRTVLGETPRRTIHAAF
ncbi:MAG: hypothetical protein EGR29_02745 [Faecalibacterium prausnitzii]|nr:hypothetical protein [Faecalibacterium prausnitzii]